MARWLPQESIRRKRDGEALAPDEIGALVEGLTEGRVGEAQIGAFLMAVRLRGMNAEETVALTMAMARSGEQLAWPAGAAGADAADGPVVDKHSTGGIGDTVSLLLGPLLAACGCRVPMVSGRGLGHTGGTLDKLESIPGYTVLPERAQLQRVLREAGVAIIGAGPRLAPADQRLYAVRDVTATVDSLPLITASILSKKLAAGLQALVLDVKFGNGAFMQTQDEARALARSLVDVACGAGLPTQALLTDMNQPLAPAAGNALEMRLAIELLCGRPPGGLPAGHGAQAGTTRLREVTLALGATLLVQAGQAANPAEARARLEAAWASGAAAERLARMVHGLGGPADLLEHTERHLASAPLCWPVPPAAGQAALTHVEAIDTRALGLVVIGLGGGRSSVGQRIDPAVGLSGLAPVGPRPGPEAPLAWVHAADAEQARAAVAAVQAAYRLRDTAPPHRPTVTEHLGAAGCHSLDTAP
jgi:thymidine phosphorylase